MTETLQPGKSIKPNVDCELAKVLIRENFQYEVLSIKELNSYDDNNFYVEAIQGNENDLKKFIFKVLNSMDSKKTGHVEAEHEVMFILKKEGVTCPDPQQSTNGKTYAIVNVPSAPDCEGNVETTTHVIRLLTYLEGKIMFQVPPSLSLLENTGEYIGRIEMVLKDYKHPALENHRSVWMMDYMLELRNFMYVIKDESPKFNMVSDILNAFENSIVPMYSQLEKGFLHGDYNEQNIIVREKTSNSQEYEIYGVIDFGDTNISFYVFEIAITLCYMMLECVKSGDNQIDPFVSSAYVLKGYQKHRIVPEIEFSLLRTLIACRLCQSLVMGAYTHSQDPSNTYVLTTAKTGWQLLDKIWNKIDDTGLRKIWNSVLEK